MGRLGIGLGECHVTAPYVSLRSRQVSGGKMRMQDAGTAFSPVNIINCPALAYMSDNQFSWPYTAISKTVVAL